VKIFVKAKPNSKTEKVEQINEANFNVFVKEPPVQGKANKAIILALARHFNTSPSKISIISGHNSRQKVIKIIE